MNGAVGTVGLAQEDAVVRRVGADWKCPVVQPIWSRQTTPSDGLALG
jgi:hypothetical protein